MLFIEKFQLTWTKQKKENIKCHSVSTSFNCQTPGTFDKCACCHSVPRSNRYKHNNFLIRFTICKLSLCYTHILSIAIGNAQTVVKIVCKRSIRLICRSSRFPVCFIVRILRIVRMANTLSTITGSRTKITGIWKYVYSKTKYKHDIVQILFVFTLNWSNEDDWMAQDVTPVFGSVPFFEKRR